ncbi:MAG: PilZ domain-containing protein [Vulcanimicrobiota bacterium]
MSEQTEEQDEVTESPSEEASEEDESSDEPGEETSSVQGESEAEESEDEEEPGETYQEMVDRRQSGRKGVKLSRLISSKIIDGDSERECYLHLVDISDGGLKINSDDPFPEDREFALEIGLAPFGNELATRSPKQTFPVKVVWTKSLVGGMVVSGLAFQNLDDTAKEVISKIMEGASPQGRRLHFRLNRVLGVELGKEGDDQQWLYPLTLDLSVEGMRICLSDPLEVGAKFPIKVFLEFELPTVQANAEVMWQETMPSGRVQVGLKFEDMSERDAMAIKTYIDQCLSQDEAHRRL